MKLASFDAHSARRIAGLAETYHAVNPDDLANGKVTAGMEDPSADVGFTGDPRKEMIENQKIRPAQVIGPLGEVLTIADLPAPETRRWVVRRKAEVVAAVNGGLLTIDEVLERYTLTLEEFAGWQRAVDRSGMQGLRVTRIQHYRDLYERQLKY